LANSHARSIRSTEDGLLIEVLTSNLALLSCAIIPIAT